MSMDKHTPSYEVMADGRIFSVGGTWRGKEMHELAQDLNKSGYPCVRIVINEKRRRVTVHSLVARTHIGPQPAPGYEIRHLDGNKLNAHYTNLAWGTRKENAADRELHGRTSRGEKHSAAIKASTHKERVIRGENHHHTRRRAALAKARGE